MKRNIEKLLLFSLIMFAIVAVSLSVNATTIKETTKTNDSYDTIEDGTIVIGISKFTPNTIITGVRAATAGANDMRIYVAKNGSDKNYTSPKMYYYLLGDWYIYDEEGNLSVAKDITSFDIYYVNNVAKKNITIPSVKEYVEPETIKYTVFYVDRGEQAGSEVVETGNKVSSVPTITRDDGKYTLSWVDKDGKAVDTSSFTPSADTILFAKWTEASKAMIIFKDGNNIETITGYIGDTVTAPTPTKTGYTFSGWYDGDTKITEFKVQSSDVTYTAKWTLEITNNATITQDILNTSGLTEVIVASDLRIESNVTIPSTVKFTINKGCTLTLAAGVTITGDITNNGTIKQEANSEDNLKTALNNNIVSEVVLTQDTSLGANKFTIESSVNKVIDLNNKTLNVSAYSSGNGAITNEGNITIKDGSIVGNSAKVAIVDMGEMTIDNVNLTGGRGIQAYGKDSNSSATLTIKNSTIKTTDDAVDPFDNSTVTIEGSTIESENSYAISGNNLYPNATVVITEGSTVTSKTNAGVYFPCDGSLTVSGKSTVKGVVGIEACEANITVTGESTIEATGTTIYSDDNMKTLDSVTNGPWINVTSLETGSAGSAIFFRIQSPYGKGTTSSILVDEGSKLVSSAGDGIRVYEATNSGENKSVSSLTITDNGTYTGSGDDIHTYQVPGNVSVTISGSASNITKVTSEGTELQASVSSASELKTVLEDTTATTKEITLTDNVADLTDSISVSANQTVTVDLNGKNITSSTSAGAIVNNGSLTLKGDGSVTSTGSDVLVNNSGATLTVEAGT